MPADLFHVYFSGQLIQADFFLTDGYITRRAGLTTCFWVLVTQFDNRRGLQQKQ